MSFSISIQEQIQVENGIITPKPIELIGWEPFEVRERMRDAEDQKVFDIMKRLENESPNT
jgi:hypothetical protein